MRESERERERERERARKRERAREDEREGATQHFFFGGYSIVLVLTHHLPFVVNSICVERRIKTVYGLGFRV